jgi:hypothetical protein
MLGMPGSLCDIQPDLPRTGLGLAIRTVCTTDHPHAAEPRHVGSAPGSACTKSVLPLIHPAYASPHRMQAAPESPPKKIEAREALERSELVQQGAVINRLPLWT